MRKNNGENRYIDCHCEECNDEAIHRNISGLPRLHFASARNDAGRAAFTLAEVLITLTIIGVIAAITIPNLMQSWRKHERITEIKTAYSILSNAIKMSVSENGDTSSWADADINKIAKDYIYPYVKTQYICGVGTHSAGILRNGCFVDNGKNGTWYQLNGRSYDKQSGGNNSYYYYTAKMQNGMDIGILKGTTGLTFVVDVNGSQGPSMAGSDVFAFELNYQTGQLRTAAPWGYSNKTKADDMINCTVNFCCNAAANEFGGMGCARVVELNHWEFPDNYPVKKF